MKKFLAKIVLFILIAVILIGFYDLAYMTKITNLGTMGKCKNDSAYIEDVPYGIELCNFGDSQGYYGFDYEEITDKTCFNFALPSQSMSYNLRILEQYKDRIEPGATVYIGISYISFFGADETQYDDFDSKNKRYYHFLSKEYIKNYDLATDIYVRFLPALAVTLPEYLEVVTGRQIQEDEWALVTTSNEAKEHGENRYIYHIEHRKDENGNRLINQDEIESIKEMIRVCREIGAKPVLITTPYLAEYTDEVKAKDVTFYDDFYGVIEAICEDEQVEYQDYQFDERFQGKYEWFMNTDHLNKVGAEEFMHILENQGID